ncbi:uncharacterized protein FIBRA_01239 [Fibroporia radiculosa]|uniref:AB hydrolase-1 domain-containing protein n=1 Tax=Fibroporia radiculosa TaxID=599839 RepID=J4H0Z8_9APHY|nr:uncharacterized protein FIBRA_01239 [Fibroporia radiculosa]CCL99224.1 predicted protein [Fibroporia radiculosa]
MSALTLCAVFSAFSIVLVLQRLLSSWSHAYRAYFRTKLHYSCSPVSLLVKCSLCQNSIITDGASKYQNESLKTFVENRCPSLSSSPFMPAWWLFNGHLQTCYSVVGDFSTVDKIEYQRTLLRTADGGTLGLDFTPPDSAQDDRPIIVVLHGLTGGSHEAYVRAVLSVVCAPSESGGLGYRAVVVNSRGCAGVPITSPQFYSAGATDDVRVAIYYIRRRYPRAILLGLAFSVGGNILTRYVAEEGESCRLAAACVLACPWDLLKNSDALERRWLHRIIYSKALGTNLQSVIKGHAASLRQFPGHPVEQALEPCLALSSPTMEMFDNTFNCIAGGSSPPFPFPDARAYYTWGSSHQMLPQIRVPFLAINAQDDPIVQVFPTDAGGNGYVVLAVTKMGGHLGWFQAEGALAMGPITRWFSKPVTEWLRAVGEDLVICGRSEKPLCEVDGFLKEVGRDDIGCIEMEAGQRVSGIEGEAGVLQGL